MQNKTVLLDSNFLLVPVQFKIDVYEEIRNLLGNPQFIILAEIFNELYLKLHRERQQKFRLELKTSLELLEQKKKRPRNSLRNMPGEIRQIYQLTII